MDEEIRSSVIGALNKAGAGDVPFTVERPSTLSYGDYAVNVAFGAAKKLGKSPLEVANDLVVPVLRIDIREDIKVSDTGFINIVLSPETVREKIAEAVTKGKDWGKGNENKGKRIIVEYSNPNAFKEMHIGHLVGTVIGESVSRLIENTGAVVARDTFGGDVGPHVAKALWKRKQMVQNSRSIYIGNIQSSTIAYVEGTSAYKNDSQAQNQIDALNIRLYEILAHQIATLSPDDAELFSLWRNERELSMEEFRRIWRLLGTHFDFEFFDSDTTKTGLRVVNDGLTKGVFQKSDGAIIYNGEGKDVHTMVFITSHNTPTYEAKDIGLAFLKEERWPSDRVIIVTGSEQIGRLETVLAALAEIAPLLAKKTTHLATGFLKLASGKMSSREGNVITAAELIEDIIKRVSEKNADPLIAEQVAIGAIKYMILRQAPGSDIIFDEEKSLSLEGDSGPYLQYALVRAKKILSYGENGKGGIAEPDAPYDIERIILHYPEVVARAARELAPNLLVNYLTELASAWNSFYAREQVLGSPEEAYKQKIARAFVNTMTNGLTLLGIPTPEKM